MSEPETPSDRPSAESPAFPPNGQTSRGETARPNRAAHALYLAAILAVALVVRVVGLGSVPPPLFRDEAEKGYNAYCLLMTDRDYEGRRLPLFINAFGTHTSAIYQYATVPLVALFGLKVWSVRLTAALVGFATVVMLYLLARALFDPTTALVAAALLAISPWHVCFSRWAQQGIFLPFLFTVAAWGTVRFRQGRGAGLAIAAAAIALAAYAYAVGRVLAPLFLLLLVCVTRREIARRKGWAIGATLVLALLVAPTLWFVTHQSAAAMARFKRISITQGAPTPGHVLGRFLVNYAKHFDPMYLAVRGDSQPRHSPSGVGEIYPVELLLILIGLVFLIQRRDAATAIVVGWIAIAPVAASLTTEGIPHALRSLAGVPAFSLAAAVGGVGLIRRLPDMTTKAIVAGFLVCGEMTLVGYFLHNYFVEYPGRSAKAWQAGLDDALLLCNVAERGARRQGSPECEVWISEAVGGLALPPDLIKPAEVMVALYEKIAPEQFQKNRLQGTSYRIVPWETNMNLELTRPSKILIYAIVLDGELSKEVAGKEIHNYPYWVGKQVWQKPIRLYAFPPSSVVEGGNAATSSTPGAIRR